MLDRRRKACPNRICQDVFRDFDGYVVVAKHVFVPVALPQRAVALLRIVIARLLLERLHEPLAVRVVRRPLSQYMHVIRHKAVRQNCELLLACGSRKLLHYKLNCRRISKQALPPFRAECQGISVETDVVEAFQVARIVCNHGRRMASSTPGPPEGGHYR